MSCAISNINDPRFTSALSDISEHLWVGSRPSYQIREIAKLGFARSEECRF